MRGRRSWVAGIAAGLALLAAGCARTPDRSAAPETPGQLIIDRIDTGSPLGRAGLEVGDVLVGARQGQVRLPVRGFADLWLLEVEYAPRGEVVLELARRGALYERTVSEERWRTTVRPALAERALALHREAQAAVAGARPADAIAAYERLRDGGGDASLRAWASVRAAQVQRSGSPAHWERAAAAAREASDESLEAWIAQKLCESLAETGAYAGAPARCEQARDARLSLGQPLAAAEAQYRLAVIAGRRGNPREEERLHRAVLEQLAPHAPEGLLAVRTLRGLAKARATQGDLPGAFENSRRALALVARRAPRGLDHASSMMNLGIFHWFAGEWQTAETRFHDALDLIQSIDPANDDVSNALSNLGLVANSRGDLVGAEEYFRRGLEAFARLGSQDPLAASRTLYNMADMATKRGDLDSAIRYDREVLELRERIVPGSIDLASILLSLGNHLIAAGQIEEGERHLERALALQRHHAPNSSDVAATLITMADALHRRGEAARAEALAAEALAMVERVSPRSELEAQTLRTLAEVRAERGQTADAERLLRRSSALLQTLLPGTLEQARTLHALGRLLRASGRREEALEPLRGAAAALDRQLATLGGTDEVRARFRESWRHIYRDLADLLLELGRKDEAFETLERSRARAFLLLLRSRDLPLTAGVSPDIERERRALAKSYDDVQEKLAERLAVHDEAGVRKLEADRRSLQLRRDQLAERLGRDAPRLAGLEAVSNVAEARAALAGSAAALSYFVDEKRTRLAVVGAKGQTEILDLPIGEAELRDLVDRFRYLLEARSPAADPSVLGARLYEVLIAPAGPLLEGAPSLLVVPDGPLHRLPFAALVENGAGARGRFLVERTSVQLAASITAWIELRRGRRGAPGRFVAFADPVLPDVRRMARRMPPEGLARLPYSRQEAEHLATLFQPSARVLEGSAASESAARGMGDGVRVLHFATHGFVDPVSPLDSALVLAPDTDASGRRDDGLLQAWEVVQDLRLDADLVALSACESGSGAAVADEGLIGLTRAFHFAGARAVLASLWKVYDRSTSTLMERFYTHWAAGRSKAEALRAAQLDMIHDGARPAQWAAFELHGDGR